MNNIIQTIRHTARAATVLLIALLATAQGAWAQETISGLTYNSTDGYYEINDAQDLVDLANYVNGGNNASGKTFKQTEDITLTEAVAPIGNYDDTYFSGTYDGGGHTISGLNVSHGRYAGLFGRVHGANLHDIVLISPIVSTTEYIANTYVGPIVAFTKENSTQVSNCTVINPTVTLPDGFKGNAGAIVGRIYNGRATNCHFYGGNQSNAIGSNFGYSSVNVSRVYTLTATGCTATATATVTVGTTSYYNSGTAVSLTAADRDGYILGYASDDVTITDGAFTMPAADVAVAATFTPDPDDFSVNGEGTEYTIHTATGWSVFCDCLDDNDTYNRFSGKTVRLGDDITVTRMAGSDHHDFCGTFDGQGHTLTVNISSDSRPYTAPFAYVSETTPTGGNEVSHPAIRNLKVAGTVNATKDYAGGIVGAFWGTLTIENCTSSVTVNTSNKYAAGFIAEQNGDASITDCRSSVTIKSSKSGDGTHGGFVAECKGVLNITGCVFDGKLLTTNGTDNCGGFVGWHYGGTTNISNSLYAPAAIAADETEVGPGTAGQNPSATFGRNAVNSIANSYYTRTLGTAQGKQLRTIAAGEGVSLGHDGVATEYSVSGITAYKASDAHGDNDPFIDGLVYNEVLYAGSGDQLSLTLSNTATGAPQGYQYDGYTASAGTLDGSTLTMPDADVTISVSTDHLASTGQAVTVAYINADGTAGEASAIALDGTETTLAAGTYFAGLENVNFDHTVNLNGNVTIILKDGCTMNVGTSGSRIDGMGFNYNNNTAMTVFGQSLGSGALSVYNTGDANNAISVEALTVNGGNVIANTDGMASNGIYSNSDITINGGSVIANTDGMVSEGIYANSDITINGGSVTAYCTGTSSNGIYANGSAKVTINGGTVNATAKNYGVKGTITLGWNKPTDRIYASSYSGTVKVADGKKLHNGSGFLGSGTVSDPAADVNGKTLRPAANATYTTADGTTDTADAILLDGNDTSLPAGNYLATGTLNYTHGITLTGNVTLILADNCHMKVGTSGEGRINGNGIDGYDSNTHVVYDLTITSQSLGSDMGALSVYTTGMNDGIYASALTINGGNITADTNGFSANALRASGGDLTINSGTVSANTTGTDADALIASGNFNYNGGNVTATAPNGTAIRTYNGNYTFSWRTPADRITIGATGLYAPAAKTATFTRLFTDADGNYYGATLTGDELNALKGVTLTGTDAISLANDASNSDIITKANNITGLTVTLKGRTLYKDGKWNTLCLPFALSAEQIVAHTDFSGATLMELNTEGKNGFDPTDGTLYLTFKTATAIAAGVPYLVKWDAAGTDFTSPTFSGVTINATASTTVSDADGDLQEVQMVGCYSPVPVVANDKSILYLGSENTLYYSSIDRAIRSCRAYFSVPYIKQNAGAKARAFRLDFGDDEATGIVSAEANSSLFTLHSSLSEWYTLDGRRLDGQPTAKGLYIHGGKKVVIK